MTSYKDYLISWLRNEVHKIGADGVIIGISGGIDSAVVSALAKEAFPNNSLGTWINIESSTLAEELSNEHAKKININYKKIDLSNLWNEFNNIAYNEEKNAKKYKEAISNNKSRLRMTALYGYAKILNYVVLGTGNRDEIYMGYFTKYGDGSADIYPIVHLSKSQIYELAKEFNIDDRIINATPSADLWDGQTDEDEMGVTYEQISQYINNNLEDEKARKIIETFHKNSLHKINNNAIIPKEYRKEK